MKKLFMLCVLATSLVNATEKPTAKVLEQIHQKLDTMSRRSLVYKYGIVPFAIYGAYTAGNNAYNNQDAIKAYLKTIQNHQEPRATLHAAAARLQKLYDNLKFKKAQTTSPEETKPSEPTTTTEEKPVHSEPVESK